MVDYTFSSLNDKEFEMLVVDLLSESLEKRIERFKAGRDGGVDGRYFTDAGNEVIIQCKHFLGSGYKQLLRTLKKEEVDKVKKLQPERYIFVTSLSLSRVNKQEIKEIFSPYVKQADDIYDQADLNNLLKKSPSVEKNHYKLWLASTTVFTTLLNNAIESRSKSYLQEINSKMQFYVETKNHSKALEILKENNVLIITGEPGIGKTTLAENLCYFYASQRYNLYVIGSSLSEAESVWKEEEKQIFYFDDFLGSNFLQALESHQDTDITRFIQRVKKDKSKKFILTSRTNIFNKALTLSDTFTNKKVDKNEFLLTVKDLTDFDKAKILYNHLWFNSIKSEYIDVLYEKKRYMDIIKHKNYSPRIIEFITDNDRISSIPYIEFWQYIQDVFDNPSEVWANTFNNQSDEYMRNIVLLVILNNNKIDEQLLKKSYVILNKKRKIQNPSSNSIEFDNVVKSTVKYFINRNYISEGLGDKVNYTLFNPSLADFVMNKYKGDIETVTFVLESLKTESSFNVLLDLYKDKYFSEDDFYAILMSLYNDAKMHLVEKHYIIRLVNIMIEQDIFKNVNAEKFIPVIHDYIAEPVLSDLFSEILLYFMNLEMIAPVDESYLVAVAHQLDDEADVYNFNALIKLINFLDTNNEDINNILNREIDSYLAYYLEEIVSTEVDVEPHIRYERMCDYDHDIIVNYDGIRSQIENELDYLIDEIDTCEYVDIDSYSLIENINIDDLVDKFYSNLGDSDYNEDRYHRGSEDKMSTIEDLFDR